MKTVLKLSSIFVVSIFSLNVEAHVTVEPKEAPAGSYAKLTFRLPHGCDGSATKKITVKIPEGFLSVKPQVHHKWKIEIKKQKLAKPATLHGAEVNQVVSEVSWSGSPVSDEYMEEFGMSVKLPDQSGTKLVFPVTQECVQGVKRWVSDPAQGHHGEHSEQLPAPVLMLSAPSKG